MVRLSMKPACFSVDGIVPQSVYESQKGPSFGLGKAHTRRSRLARHSGASDNISLRKRQEITNGPTAFSQISIRPGRKQLAGHLSIYTELMSRICRES